MTITIAKDSELATKSGPELVAVYNELAQKLGIPTTQRFSTRDVGVRRIVALLSEHPELQVAPVKKPSIPADLAKKSSTKEKAPKASVRPFDLKASLTKRPYRPNCGRGKLITALREGRTFAQLQKEFTQWDADRLEYTIRKLSNWLGFAVKENAEGVIRLTD